jgi:general secretion pathway protein A
VLIIDEAQNLSADVLEQIRLLTNLETSTQQLLQIILIGQPELRTLLQREDMRQLAQRVTARYHLEPVTREDTGAYIKHRLQVCGATRPIFSKAAVDLVYKLSGGIPRLINVLCDRALLGAYTENKLQIDKKIVRQAAHELQQSRTRFSSKLLVGGLAVLILVSTLLYIYWQRPELDHVLDQATAQSSPEMSADDTSVDKPSPQSSTALSSNALPDVTTLSSPDTQSGSLAAALQTANESWSLAAWTGLFARWSVKLPAAVEPEYCVFANDMQLSCLVEHGSWGLLRQYNRPVIMGLFTDDGQSVPVLLQHLDDRVAELIIGDELFRLAIGEVDRYWVGNFTLLLQSPPNGHLLLQAGDRNPDVVWLRQLLEEAQQVKLAADDPQYFDIPLQKQVMDFQRSHKLTPDGIVGKHTLIQLNTYADRNVPLLSVESS